ncbi:MAG TPA: response regulator transcription factor [Acidimicrobiales bacterium]|nr:response regulator transcription factor [Acidimicrobiales bacterium]
MAGARVLVVDDEPTVRRALEFAFRQEGYSVRSEPDGSALQAVTEEFRPDVAVLDVRLPVGPDGYAMARMFRKSGDVPVLLLTAADSLENRLTAFDAGADDHVGKPFSTAEVLARTQALLRRAGRLAATVLTVGDIVIDDATHRVARADQPIELTRTEYDLLSLLARNSNQILSKQQLLIKLWDFDAYDPNIIEVHMSALRKKIEVHGPRLIHTVRSVGYVLRPS